MPVYRYRGIDQKGEEVKGQLRAADQEQLYALLLEKGCHLTWAKKSPAPCGDLAAPGIGHPFSGGWAAVGYPAAV